MSEREPNTDPANPALPPRRSGLQWRTILALAIVWMVLWGDLSIFAALMGLLVGLIITLAFPMPPVRFAGRFRPLRVAWLLVRLLGSLTVASIDVIRAILRPGPPLHSGIIRVPLRVDDDLYEALVSELASLVPGSLVIEARRSNRTLYLHVLEATSADDLAQARLQVRRAEDAVLAAFGSREEQAAIRQSPGDEEEAP
ncbi:Na+/H+ antiporter subunit E [Naumannella huperziae]